MALIDVNPRMFDPEERPAALFDAARAILGRDELTEQEEALLTGAASFLDQHFPDKPDDVADYLEAVGLYLSFVVANLAKITAEAMAFTPERIDALEARIAALE